MGVLSSWTCSIFGFCGGIMHRARAADRRAAGTVTACTAIDLCYCVNTEVRSQIDANVTRVRQLIADQRKQDKAIGYMSIPLSTAGGSYFGVNHRRRRTNQRRIWKSASGRIPLGSSIRGRKATCRRRPPAPTICSCGPRYSKAPRGSARISISSISSGRRRSAVFRARRHRRHGKDRRLFRAATGDRPGLEKGRRQRPGQQTDASATITRCVLRSRSATARTTSGISRESSTNGAAARLISASPISLAILFDGAAAAPGAAEAADRERRRGPMHQLTVTATPRSPAARSASRRRSACRRAGKMPGATAARRPLWCPRCRAG